LGYLTAQEFLESHQKKQIKEKVSLNT